MKKIPILIELIVLLFLLLVVPTSLVTYYSSRSMLEYSEEEIAESAMAKLESNSALVEMTLDNIVRSVLQFINGNNLNKLRGIESYKTLNASYDSVESAVNMLSGLNEIVYNNSAVHSVYLYLDNADYVISTDRGIVRLDSYEDMGWLNTALEENLGPGGVWHSRIYDDNPGKDDDEGTNVISYVLKISKLVTATRGTIVVNVAENKINEYLNSNKFGTEMEGFLLDKSGTIISHTNNDMMYKKFSEYSYVSTILNGEKNKISGFEYIKTKEESSLYTYYKTTFNNWTYIAKYSMNKLMQKSEAMRTKYLFLTIIIIIAGTMLSIVCATRFSKPMRELAKEIRKIDNLELDNSKNELEFIAGAFDKIKNQEEELHRLLKAREEETKNLALHNLLLGEVANDTEREEIVKQFPYNHYIVALAAVDNYKSYIGETNHDLRSYHRYLIFNKIKENFPKGYKVSCVKYEGGMLAIIININEYDHGKVPRTIGNILTIVKKEVFDVMGYTVTIGISAVHNNFEGVKDCTFEATEAVKNRLLQGCNSIIFWKSNSIDNRKYHYSYSSEKKILNFLANGDFGSIENELTEMIEGIKHSNGLSNDNIWFIFNQLAGATVKYMAEHNINSSKLFNNKSIYSIITEFDTIEEIEKYLIELYKAIIDMSSNDIDVSETKYYEQVMKYINENYKEDIVFEELADKIGISYSYLRRLVKDGSGKSLIDNVNTLRIEEVKRLLLQTNMSISQIAASVGYRNVQSVNRFFKKYEGISPTEFKGNQN